MIRRALPLVAVVGLFSACSSSTPSTAPPSSAAETPTSLAAEPSTSPSTTASTSTTTTAAPTTAPTTTAGFTSASWQAVSAPSDCVCADGSPYTYWVRKADPTKVVFFMQGGGACFDAKTCAFDGSNTYKTTVTDRDDPSNIPRGIFDFTNVRNPFADYSFVFVPYCTGDLHLGKATHQYAPNLTVHHNGSVNATTALRDMATEFPEAESVVVAGESAGSAPTPLYAGLAHDLLPGADIAVLADGSGAYPDVPGIDTLIGQLWGAQDAHPPWPEVAGVAPGQWSLPGLFVRAHEHDPAIIFARHDYAFDAVQAFFAGLTGVPADNLLSLIDANETQIEKSGVDLHSYIAPGDSHTVLSKPEFYTETVEGVAFVDWVSDLVHRQPAPDVHCTSCTASG